MHHLSACLLTVCVAAGVASAQANASLNWRLLPVPVTDNHGMVFDSVRQRFVLLTDRTWEWDGVDWRDRHTASLPNARSAYGMAFDEARGRTVVFGGVVAAGSAVAEVWEYDGVDWTQMGFAAGPPARWSAAMAYDPIRARVFVYGGRSPAGQAAQTDVWAWDGASWTSIAATGPVPAPGTVTMAYHAATARTVLLCSTANNRSTETWTFDGSTWQQEQPATVPPLGGDGFRAWSDRAAGVVRATGDATGTVWAWDGTDWSPSPGPTLARGYFAVACDAASTTLLHGGKVFHPSLGVQLPAITVGDTWRLQSGNWSLARDTGPTIGGDNAVAFDLVHDRVLCNSLTAAGRNTLVWSQGAWRVIPGALPSLGDARLCHDFVRDRFVLFGGGPVTVLTAISTSPTDNLYEFDGVQWQRIVAVGPAPRSKHAMAFDPLRAEVVMFGGSNGTSSFGDTWLWNGVQWRQGPATGPSPRYGAAMAADRRRFRIVLFGGTAVNQLNDTWLWDGATWNQTLPPVLPPARRDAGFDFDATRGVLVLAGGRDYSAIGDQWEWDGAAWSQAVSSIPETLSPREVSAIAGTGNGMLRVANGRTWFGAVTNASVSATGSGCGSPVPALIAMGEPALGRSTFALEVHRVAANAPFALGLGGGPASIPLGSGCTLLLASIDLVSIGTASAVGRGVVPVPVPDSSALRGVVAVAQGAALDPTAPLGFVLTNGLLARVGD